MATLGLLWAPAILSSAARWSEGGSISWPAATLGGSAVAFLPVSALLGAIPPVLVRAALGAPAAHGRVVGWFYAIGTVGAVAGAVLAAAALIPLAGLERTILFVAFALACCCAYVWRRKSYAVYALYALILAPAVLLHGPWEEGRALARRLALPVDEDVLHVEDSRYSRIRVQSMSEVDQEFRTAVPGTLGTIEVAGDPVLHLQGFYDEERGLLHWRGAMRIEQRDRLVALGGNADAVDRLYDRVLHARQLRLDRLVHGGVDPTDPTWLWYGYERLQATLLAHLWPDEGPVRCFFIGGGAYAFPRFLLATRGEGLRITTAEIDPRVTAVARTWLGLAEDPRHRILDEDARTALRGRAGAHDFDFVFGDAFDHIAVPFHLTTIEFDREVKARLKPGGVYMVNVIDSMDSGLFLGAMLHTLGFVFDRVYLVSEEPRTSVGRYAWLVVATDRDLGLEGRVLDSARGGRARVADTATVAAVVRRAKRRVLTDDDAPVEKLLAPVVYASPRR